MNALVYKTMFFTECGAKEAAYTVYTHEKYFQKSKQY